MVKERTVIIRGNQLFYKDKIYISMLRPVIKGRLNTHKAVFLDRTIKFTQNFFKNFSL